MYIIGRMVKHKTSNFISFSSFSLFSFFLSFFLYLFIIFIGLYTALFKLSYFYLLKTIYFNLSIHLSLYLPTYLPVYLFTDIFMCLFLMIYITEGNSLFSISRQIVRHLQTYKLNT